MKKLFLRGHWKNAAIVAVTLSMSAVGIALANSKILSKLDQIFVEQALQLDSKLNDIHASGRKTSQDEDKRVARRPASLPSSPDEQAQMGPMQPKLLIERAPNHLNYLWIILWASSGSMAGVFPISARYASILFILPIGTVALFLGSYVLLAQGWWLAIFPAGVSFKLAVLASRHCKMKWWLDQQCLQQSAQEQVLDQYTERMKAQGDRLTDQNELLAKISHELRSPLHAILGISELLQTGQNLSPQEQQNIEIIQYSGQHLLELVSELLTLAAVNADKSAVESQPIELRKLAENVVAMFHCSARQKNVKLRCSIDDRLPTVIWSDEKKLRQVLINLLSNALKFTRVGHITVRLYPCEHHDSTQCSSDTNDLDHLCFEVEDTGIGISSSQYEVIFYEFNQGDISREMENSGLGLGLAISRKLVEQMGGKIWVHSQEGIGSRFQFTIPFHLRKSQLT